MSWTIAGERPDGLEALALIAESDAYFAALYPPESCHLLDARELLACEAFFVGARGAGRLAGIGALIERGDGFGEIKRVYVVTAARGQGLGARIVAALEREARNRRLRGLRLETGVHQPEAVALFQAARFRHIGPFGTYKPDPLSLFMEKRFAER